VDERALRMKRRLEWPLLIAALLTIPALVIEESDAGAPWDAIATALNWATWLTFLAEVVLMLAVVPDRWRWLRTHPLDLAIVILTPPFLPASLQAARLLRLVRLLALVRGAVVLRRLLSTEGVRDAAVLALLTVLGGGAAYAAVEPTPDGSQLSSWDGVWWAITTVTTVGYGDTFPVTTTGRILAVIVMFVGIGFVAVLTAAAAERFMRTDRRELEAVERRLEEISKRLDAALGARSDAR
jgi:voltage-gated potassium channel